MSPTRQHAAGLALEHLVAIAGGVPVNVTLPEIVGTAQVGSTLRWVNGAWTDPANIYLKQWCAGGAPIQGATDDTYRPTNADVGTSLTVVTTAVSQIGLSASVTSRAVVVAGAGGSTSSPGGGPNNTADHSDPNNAYLLALLAA